ncbi:MAG: 50S ribosomal protein L34 [Planctomycetes bacterium]|nr:50S ribosomal protein L34 [Planctomycetota bacterium]
MKMGRRLNRLPKKRKSGFRKRMKSPGGRKVIKRRRRKGCWELSK